MSAYMATLSPDGGTLLTLLIKLNGAAIQLTGPANSVTDVHPVDSDSNDGALRPTYLAPDWSSSNTVLVQRSIGDTALLLTMEPANGESATPVAPCSCTPPATN